MIVCEDELCALSEMSRAQLDFTGILVGGGGVGGGVFFFFFKQKTAYEISA